MPAKKSDSRTAAFVDEHGDMAMELDALPPDLLQELVEGALRLRRTWKPRKQRGCRS